MLCAAPALSETRCKITYSKDFAPGIAVGDIALDETDWLDSARVPVDPSWGYAREITIALILDLPTAPPHMEITLYNNAGKEGRGSVSVPLLRPGESGHYELWIHNHGDNEPGFEQVDADCRAISRHR